ncbi:unnamed protein product [Ectocarpus sp. CCAP 1310/34]|nr:unnamed protein product [Ectocarpus sp. CCAP 1310/34]
MLMIAPHLEHRCTNRCAMGRSVGSGKPSPTQERQKHGRRRRPQRWSEMAMFALSFNRILVTATSLSLTATAADVSPGVSTTLAERHEHARAEPIPKPNVFFIIIDDMGWNDMGYQSTDMHAVTPNLNRLAESGVKLSQYYSMSICTPARAALMTGRYPVRYGFQYDVIHMGAPWGLPLTEKLFPQFMNDAGYTSHMVGKWHLGSHTFNHMPHRRGFETYLGYTQGRETYWTHEANWHYPFSQRDYPHQQPHQDGIFFDFGFGNETGYYDVMQKSPPPAGGDGEDSFSARSPSSASSSSASPLPSTPSSGLSSSSSSDEVKREYSSKIFTDRALEILQGRMTSDDKPLFMYLAYQAVHEPLDTPPADAFSADELEVLDALKDSSASPLRIDFAKVLMYLDKSIGRLVDYLEREGWMDNSIIVVASDNGGCPNSGGSNFPLRGTKASYWEGGTKVPALVYSPSHIPEERRGGQYDGLMHVTDWLPTLTAATGSSVVESHRNLDGVNHWEHIIDVDSAGCGAEGGSSSRGSNSSYSPRNEMLYNFDPYFMGAERDRPLPDPDISRAQGAFRQGQWKLLFKVCCLGHYALETDTSFANKMVSKSGTCRHHAHDNQQSADPSMPRDAPDCYEYGCVDICVDVADCKDWLFDLENDPTEEHDLADTYPEVVQNLRDRVFSVVDQEYSDSLWAPQDMTAYHIWESHNYWVVPWLEPGLRYRAEEGVVA